MTATQVADERRAADSASPAVRPRRGPRRALPAWWIHLPFAAVVLIAIVPRVVATLGYQPILFFWGDSYAYLASAQAGTPASTRPFGYSAFLRLMAWTDQLWLVAVVQHVAIVVFAVLLYRWLIRRGAPVWLATIVPTPMLLDGYQILTEHGALTETLFVVFLLGCVFLVMRESPTLWQVGAAGALLAGASLTRTVAVPLVVLVIGYLLLRRMGWRRVVTFALAFSIPLLGYAAWYQSTQGAFALQQDGRFLYARVAPFADCERMELTPLTEQLCVTTPIDARPSPNFYAWDAASPLAQGEIPDDADVQEVARDFAVAAIVAQPFDYARTVISDTVQYFAPGRIYTRLDTPPAWWNFPDGRVGEAQKLALSGSGFRNDSVQVGADPAAVEFLRDWQRSLATQGPILLLGLILGVLGAIFGRTRRGGVDRWDSLLPTSMGVALLALASATSVFDYRYGIPAAILLYVGGGVGALALRQRSHIPDVAERQPPKRRRAGRWALRDWSTAQRRTLVAGVVGVVALGIAFSPVERQPIYNKYIGAGAERGSMGYPVSDERPSEGLDGWVEREFEGGLIMMTPNRNVYLLSERTARSYAANGGAAELGRPTSSTRALNGSTALATWFADGAIVVPPNSDALTVRPPLLEAWCLPAKRCALGVPVSEAIEQGDTTLQQFERGVLVQVGDEDVRVLPRPDGVPSALPAD